MEIKEMSKQYKVKNIELEPYLKETLILNFNHPELVALVESRNWNELSDYDKIGAIYDFVQNEILFGYNESDDLPATAVLRDGYGQCNTKSTLIMALLRSVGIPCRFHGFTIDKTLQKGAITGIPYQLAPQNIIHSWVEVLYEDEWINLEGFILDNAYLNNLQEKFSEAEGSFCGYGVATNDFKNPQVAWVGNDTYIQKEGINNDFGVFDEPDSFYAEYGANVSGLKALFFKTIARKLMNANVARIRLARQG